jgi:hypothetical protein
VPDPMRGVKRPEVVARRKQRFAEINSAEVAERRAKKMEGGQAPSSGSGGRRAEGAPPSPPSSPPPLLSSPTPPPKSKAARVFHEEAFKCWVAEKLTYLEVGKRFGVSEKAVIAWKNKEGWEKLRDAIVKKAQSKIVEKEADRLARTTRRQTFISRVFQKAILKALSDGTLQMDPMTGKAWLKPDGVTPERRELLPGELNQAAQAFEKVAKLEWERLGGKTTSAGTLDVRFPDLVALLEKIDKGRAPRTVEGAVVSKEPLALAGTSDPREAL